MTFLLVILLASYLVMTVMFLIAAWGTTRCAKWLGLAAIAAAAPFFFWLGTFSEQFGAGQCYSNVVSMIANAVEKTNAPQDLSKKIRALPMRGYETICSEVEIAGQRLLPDAGAP